MSSSEEITKENEVQTPILSESTDQAGGDYKKTAKRNFRSKAPRREKVKPDFDQKIILLRRVTRVMAGGRRFSFSVSLVIGDKNGRVGVGQGKASDTSLAIEKAFNDAKNNLIKLKLNDDMSIDFGTQAKFNSAQVELRPNYGRGLVAGSALRTVLEFAGVRNITAKVLSRSRNKMNNAYATLAALDPFVSARGSAAHTTKSGGAPIIPLAEIVDLKIDEEVII